MKGYIDGVPFEEDWSPEAIRASLPELPDEARRRYADRGLGDCETIIADPPLKQFFDRVLEVIDKGS